MKKISALLLSLVLVICLFTGCSQKGSTSQTDDSGKKALIGVCTPSMSQSIYVLIGDAMKKTFSDCDVQIASCDDNVSTQIQQINNFVLQGAAMLVIMPTQIEALTDAITKAHDAGCKIVIDGSTGDGSALDGKYDTCTVSDEYLIGTYVAMIAKNWAESHMDANGDWEACFLTSNLNVDTVRRSDGIKSILNEYLKNTDGKYVDTMGNVVNDAHKVANPAYSKLVADHYKGAEVEQDMAVSNYTTVTNLMTKNPKARLFICYNSLASTQGGQYIVDKYPSQLDEFGFFSAGVMGDEPNYMVGSVSKTDGTLSVFRGACQFGGGDVAGGLADLCHSVLYGTAGKDYAVKTPQGIGAWWAVDTKWSGDGKAALAYFDVVNAVTVQAFEPIKALTDANTHIYWDSANGFNKDAQAAVASAPAAASSAPADASPATSPAAWAKGPISEGKYTYDEVTPYGFTVNWTVVLNKDSNYSINEKNPQMGDSTYEGSTWKDNGDGTFTTGPMNGDKRPMAAFFSTDGSCTWGNVGDGTVVGIDATAAAASAASAPVPSSAATAIEGGKAYSCDFKGAMGTDKLEIDLLNDGTCKFFLPGSTMVKDVYAGTYTVKDGLVYIKGLKNVDASSSYVIPGLWSFIDAKTGDCSIKIDDVGGTFTPA